VPSYIYLRGDLDPLHCNEPADVVLHRVEAAAPEEFVQFVMTPYARDDEARTAYARAGDVVAVMPMHPREFEAEMDDPPVWY
jgi:hypothetical protein